MQTVTVIGGAGYLGRHILAHLTDPVDAPEVESVITMPSKGELRDPRAWSKATREAVRSSVVVWAAGARPPATGFDRSVIDLGLFLETVQPQRFILVSSNAAWRPATDYGWAKWMQEQVVRAWASVRAANVRIVRLVHLYGDAENETRERMSVVDRWIDQRRNGEEIRVAKGVGFDMMHVDDAGFALADLAIATRQYGSVETVDLGSGIRWPLYDLAKMAASPGSPKVYAGPAVELPIAGAHHQRIVGFTSWTPLGWIMTKLGPTDAASEKGAPE